MCVLGGGRYWFESRDLYGCPLSDGKACVDAHKCTFVVVDMVTDVSEDITFVLWMYICMCVRALAFHV